MEVIFRDNTNSRWKADFFVRILNKSSEVLKIKSKNLSMSVNLISATQSRALNNKFRRKDKSTNVLSFPLDIKSGDLGDIFICLSIAKKEAKEENISVGDKIAWLTVHGFLHLLGYDHERSKKEEKQVLKLETRILKELK